MAQGHYYRIRHEHTISQPKPDGLQRGLGPLASGIVTLDCLALLSLHICFLKVSVHFYTLSSPLQGVY